MAINVTGTIVPMGSFGSVIDTDIKGGFQVVDTMDDLTNIHVWRRKWGMIVIVSESSEGYMLKRNRNSDDLADNANWVKIDLNLPTCDLLYEEVERDNGVQFQDITDPFGDGSCVHFLPLDYDASDEITGSSDGITDTIQTYLVGAIGRGLYQQYIDSYSSGEHGLEINMGSDTTVSFGVLNTANWALSFFYKRMVFSREADVSDTEDHTSVVLITSDTGLDSGCGGERIELRVFHSYDPIEHKLTDNEPYILQVQDNSNCDLTQYIFHHDECDLSELGWLHYCLNKNGTTLQYYVNGTLIGESNNFLETTNYTVTRFLGGNNSSVDRSFSAPGGIDNIRLFNRTLTPDEIHQLSLEVVQGG